MLNIYLVQMNAVLNNKIANFNKVRELLNRSGLFVPKNTAEHCCDISGIIILPEMFATGYIPENPAKYAEDFSLAETGETAKFLSQLADETGCAVMGAGISFAPNGASLQNHSSVYIPGNKREFASYNKRKPFFPETDFLAGDSVSLFKLSHWNIASVICYDLRFPELFRDAVKMGAQLITVQAAWPLIRQEHWMTLLKARAIENQVYMAAVNQYGLSMVISPTGEVLADATSLGDGSGASEGVISSTILSVPQEEYRRSFPVLKGII